MPDHAPIDESTELCAISPYGRTKLYTENLMRDVCASDSEWRIILLRYFNPVAAHPSGVMGEHPVGVPLNLMPYVQQVAIGIRKELSVYGDDYDTRDGTYPRPHYGIQEAHAAGAHLMRRHLPYRCRHVKRYMDPCKYSVMRN
jgi:UDP-glucose 4-epimerase